MPKATILFADNDPDFLKTRAEFLEQEGYLVISAANPTEARRKLETGRIDLAILDIRLENDEDDHDTSGLTLAKEVARTVPKIILTGFPSYKYVREALAPQVDGLPAAVDFLDKQEGPEALLRAIQKALSAPRVAQAVDIAARIKPEEGGDEIQALGDRARTQRKLWLLMGAFASLVLAAGTGIGAVISGDPRLLLGTFLLAFLMVVCIIIWNFME